MKPATVAEILQRIEEKIGDEIKAFPSHIRRYGVTNIFHRSLSYLFGWDEDDKARKVRVSLKGAIHVAQRGYGYNNLEIKTGTATNIWSSKQYFDIEPSYVRFETIDYPYDVQISIDNYSYLEPFTVTTDSPRDIYVRVYYFRVIRTGGNDAHYQVFAYE